MGFKTRLALTSVIFIAIIMLCVGSVYIGYTQGQDKGYDTGQQAGQEASYNQGYNEGKEEGYQSGYDAGYESGTRESSGGYDLRNPTYEEMKEFLARDTTDSNNFMEDEYVCTDYSAEVKNNALAQGISCAFVYISYPKAAHSIVAFETQDRGLKFIEPQSDEEVSLIVNKSYSQINNFTRPEVDDTIERFVVIW
jgi:hypothetical protein